MKFKGNYNIEIAANRWFSPTYGNTYHAVRVWVTDNSTGETIDTLTSTECYGYGRQYLSTVYDLLVLNGYVEYEPGHSIGGVKNSSTAIYDYVRDTKVIECCLDVKRKKHLFRF